MNRLHDLPLLQIFIFSKRSIVLILPALSLPLMWHLKKKKTLNGSGVLSEVVHTRLVVAYIPILQIGSCLGTGPQTLLLERWHCLQDNSRLKYRYNRDCWLFCQQCLILLYCFILKVSFLQVITNFALPADLVAPCDKYTEQSATVS